MRNAGFCCAGRSRFATTRKFGRNARTCSDDSAVVVSAVPGSTNTSQADPAVVRRICRCLDDLSNVFPARSAARLRLCALANATTREVTSVSTAHPSLDRELPHAADYSGDILATRSGYRACLADSRAIGRNRRVAVLSTRIDSASFAEMAEPRCDLQNRASATIYRLFALSNVGSIGRIVELPLHHRAVCFFAQTGLDLEHRVRPCLRFA